MKDKRNTTEAEWAMLSSVNCSTCGKELLKVYGPLNQYRDCFYKSSNMERGQLIIGHRKNNNG